MAAKPPPSANGSKNGSAGAFLGKPRATGYAPKAYGYTLDFNDQRPFFRLVDVERMRRDPQVSFALRILRAPLRKVKFAVRASAPEVGQFVERQLARIWKRFLVKLCKMFAYGYAPGEWVYGWKRGADGGLQIVVKDLIDFHPFDAAPLELEGQLVGLQVKGVPGEQVVKIGAPRFCWVVGDAEYNSYYGRSRLLNCWTPWMEKTGRHGALDIRRLWYLKNAYSGRTMRHPPGTTQTDAGIKDNQDIAREIAEKMETGGIVTFDNSKDEGGSEYAWKLEESKVGPAVTDIREYPKDLDSEILRGASIPPEVVQASGESGSGYAGRAIPAQVFYASEDEAVDAILMACDRQCLRPMVTFNFGPEAWYEIEPESLVPKDDGPPKQPPGMPQPGDALDTGEGSNGDGGPKQPGQKPQAPMNDNPDYAGLSLDAVQREAKRRYPLSGWVMLANGEWVKSVRVKRKPVALGFKESDHPRDDSGQFVEAMGAIPKGDRAIVGGHSVRRLDDSSYRLETDRHHVTGDATTVAARIKRNLDDQKPDQKRAIAALDRAKDYEEPDPFTEPDRFDAEAQAMAAVPKGARGVSLDPQTRGRLGTVKKEKDDDGNTIVRLVLDETPDISATDFEPLDTAHSWRDPNRKQVERPQLSVQPTLFSHEGKGKGRWITIGGSKSGDGKRHGGSPVYIENGRITKGAPSLTGKKIEALKEEGDEQKSVFGSSHVRGDHPGHLPETAFAKMSDLDKAYRSNYFNEQGGKIASSKETPAALNLPAVGSWRIDDTLRGSRGRGIEQLRELSPEEIKGLLHSEDLVEHNHEGRSWDADRYAEWMKEGKQAPPVELVETDDGKLKISDGHRRVAAALRAGKSLKAWVSPSFDIGQMDSNGKPIKAGLTYEVAQAHAKQLASKSKGEHRQQLNQSKSYARAKFAKQARQEGLDPRALHQLAGEILAHDHELANGRKALLQNTRKTLKGYGVNLNAFHIHEAHGRQDSDSVRKLDEVAKDMALEHPEQFAGAGDDLTERLYELLKEGNPEPMSEEDAYEHAVEQLRYHKQQAAAEPKADASSPHVKIGDKGQISLKAPGSAKEANALLDHMDALHSAAESEAEQAKELPDIPANKERKVRAAVYLHHVAKQWLRARKLAAPFASKPEEPIPFAFRESDHPRADDGRFGDKAGEHEAKADTTNGMAGASEKVRTLVKQFDTAPDGSGIGQKGDIYDQWRQTLAKELAAYPTPDGWDKPAVDHDAWSTYIQWDKTYEDADGDEQTTAVKVRLSNHNSKGTHQGTDFDIESQLGRRDGKAFDPEGDAMFAALPKLFAKRDAEITG